MINSQKKQKVVLISLYERASLGVRAIFSSLKNKDIDASIIFFKDLVGNNIKPPTDTETDKLIELLKELNPTIIGISVRSSYFKLAADLTRKIKKETNALIVWGGTHPTICPEDCVKYADVVCQGDGEQLMAEIVEKQNIDKIMTGPPSHLDTLPVYDENSEYVIESDTIQRGIAIKGYTKYVIMASRGCPFSCTYCCNGSLRRLYPKGKFVRRRSIDSVIQELEEAKKLFRNLRMIFFVDELFVTDKEWLKEFMERYKKSINLPFEIQLHPNYVKEDIITILKQGGLKNIDAGVESGSQRILYDIYKRHTSRNTILNMHKTFLKYKIKTSYDIILDNPLEDDSDKRETLDLLLELKRPFLLNIFSLTHFPKTELTELLLKKGIIKREDIEDISTKTFTNWKVKLNTGDLFWNALISLTPHPVPKPIIRYMSHSHFLKKHPKPLIVIASIFRIIRVFELAMGMFIRGELNIPTVRQRIKSIRNIT